MSLTISLNNALSGLRVNQQALSVLSNNIANANTPGYSRKVIGQSSNIVNNVGAGATVEDVVRKVDEYLNVAMQRQTSEFGKADIKNEFAERMQLLLGQPGDGGALNNVLTSFFNTFQVLAENPERASERLSAVISGETVARNISNLAGELQTLRYQADQEIKSAVSDINSILSKLDSVNNAISLAFNAGQSTAELADKRDLLIRDLSEYLDISTYETTSGQKFVFSSNGVSLEDESNYRLVYNPQGSPNSFIADASLNPIQVFRVNDSGELTGTGNTLVTGGPSSDVTTGMTNGKIRGLLDMRDAEIPAALELLDTLAATLRDQVNAVHNAGSSYPGANTLTGTRAVNAAEFYEWSGSVRLALLDVNGQPVPNVFANENGDLRPLTIDLENLNTGQGTGQPNVQGLINEINYHFNLPQNKTTIGDINNIRLVSQNTSIPGSPPVLNFDFDIENITGGDANFFVNNITVLDDGNIDITSVTSSAPSVSLASTGTYSTTSGSNLVTITSAAAHNFTEGDLIYLDAPGSAINGIPAAELGGMFRISNVTSTTFQVEALSSATSTGAANVASLTAKPKYATAEAGQLDFTRENGSFALDVSANSTSQFYLVQADISVENADGTYTTSTVQYRVVNGAKNNFNRRYGGESVISGSATIATSTASSPLVTAKLVDANGKELPKANGAYTLGEDGYLQIKANNSTYYLAIDSLDSQQLGFPSASTQIPGTNRGFSHYFELNNFFVSNQPTSTGDTTAGSAINMAIESRLRANPNLISLGQLKLSTQSLEPGAAPLYTYERTIGDNSIIQQLAGLIDQSINFTSAGGLGDSTVTLSTYAGNMLGLMASSAQELLRIRESSLTILEGFEERTASISGVNLDEELGNTLVYQNAYSASARIINVTSSLFETLIDAFR